MKLKTCIVFVVIILFVIFNCTLLDKNTIEGEWKLISIAGYSNENFEYLTYEFDNGVINFLHKKYNREEVFTYSMSGNIIEIEGSNSVSAILVDSSYKTYLFGNEMIWYNQYASMIEAYRFERI